MRLTLLAVIIIASFSVTSQAELHDRGGGMIYDDVLDITWLQDANQGAGSAFDHGDPTDGSMSWDNAVAWADSLVFGGFSDWRLPSTDVNGDHIVTGTWLNGIADCGGFYDFDIPPATEMACRDNELGYMFYHNLGGSVYNDLTGDQGLFTNIQDKHWSSTGDSDLTYEAFIFNFDRGYDFKDTVWLALPVPWAVRDGDVAITRGDMNGDGKADILWRHTTNGLNYVYLMNGTTIQVSAPINTVPDLNWKIFGNGDMNGDGKADILWRNMATGENYLYLMNGSTIESSTSINVIADLNWTIVGNGDMNGDGKADILWRNVATGENYVYLMNGSTIESSTSINVIADLNWTIVGNGDMNGDGKADIVWRNMATGENYVYLMNGSTIQSRGYINLVSDLNWMIVGNNDMNGDGKADIVWRNMATGENYVYLMNGSTIQSRGYINLVSDLNWMIVGNNDMNGDGKADILWRNIATGENYVYLMNGMTIESRASINTIADFNWQIFNAR